jgi:membrane protease YdiL (CAAX protease family)
MWCRSFPTTTRRCAWRTSFDLQWTVYIALGLLAFLIIGGHPNWPALAQTAPRLPLIMLPATMNAFSEELSYRAALLGGLEAALGSQQALWLAALFFAIGHYFVVPYGAVGVVMATCLGWLSGKAMVETRGFFWAWFIHLAQDVLSFAFMAAGSIRPGG